MVLKGAVKPITDPYLNESNQVPDSRSSTPLVPEESQKEVKKTRENCNDYIAHLKYEF